MNKKKSLATMMVVALVMLYSLPAAGQIPQIYSGAVSDKGVEYILNTMARSPLLSTVLSQPFDQTQTTQQVYIASQFAVGGGYTSTMTVQNVDGLDIAWQARFYDPSGKTMDVWPHTLSPGGDPPRIPVKSIIGGSQNCHAGWAFELYGTSLQTGYIRYAVNGSIPMLGLKYTLKDSQGVVLSSVNVQAVAPAPLWNMQVTASQTEDPGIAVVNPNDTDITVTLDLYDDYFQSGSVPYSTVTRTIPAGQQIALFLKELFPKLPLDDGGGNRISPGGFLQIYAPDGSLFAVSGVQYVSTNTGPNLMTAMPVTAGAVIK